MKTAILSCLVLSVLLGGCAKTMLTKDGYTQAGFEADHFECKQRAFTMHGGFANMGLADAILARQDMFLCLKTKGYREVPAEPQSSGASSPNAVSQ